MKMKPKIVLKDMHGRPYSITCVSDNSDDSQDRDESVYVSSSTSSTIPMKIAVGSNTIGKKAEIVKTTKKYKCITKTRRSRSRKDQRQSIIVQHNYHDHANDPWILEDGEDELVGSDVRNLNYPHHIDSSSKKDNNNDNNGVVGVHAIPFPVKLYELLSMAEIDGFRDIVGWQPHGRCFIINKPLEFLRDILPKHFGLQKLASFQRQLNLYGFKRLTTGRDKNGYYHELFLRGRLDLIHSMLRVKIKGTGIRPKANPSQEPDFWESMCWVPDIIESQISQDNDKACTPNFVQSINTDSNINSNIFMNLDSSNDFNCCARKISVCSSMDNLESSWSSLSAVQAIQMRLDESMRWMSMLRGQMRSSCSQEDRNCHPATYTILSSNNGNNSSSFALHDDWVGNCRSVDVKSNGKIRFHNDLNSNAPEYYEFPSDLQVSMPSESNGLADDRNSDWLLDYDLYRNNLKAYATDDESDSMSLLDETDMTSLLQELEESVSPEALENDRTLADLLMEL